MAKQSSSSRKQPQQRVNPLRWRTLPPFMKRRILSGYVVLVVLIFGVYVCATNYGYWFGNKTRDGFRIDREAPVVTQAGYEEVPAPDGDHTLYVPEVRTLTLTPNQLDQTLEIGNHPDSVYFLAYVISVPVLQGDTEVLKQVYRSDLYGQGKGTETVQFTSTFTPGTYPAQIEYRYYYHNGMLRYVASETRAITIIVE